MVNIEIIIGVIAIAVVLAIFAPLMFDPRGSFDLLTCDEGEVITFDDQENAICVEIVPVGDGSGSFSNENTEFRPHLVQGTDVQDPIVDFDGYKIRVMEFLSTVSGMVSWDYLVPEEYESGEDLEFTLYWFKEDGLPDLSVIPHYYEEVTSCGETTSFPTTILTVSDVAEFDFEQDEDYLILATTTWGGGTADDDFQVNVRHGTTLFEGSKSVLEPEGVATSPCNASEEMYKYFWWTLYTPNATEATEDITINVQSMVGLPFAQSEIVITDDDAEENTSDGGMSLSSSDLELDDQGNDDGFVGMRFTAVDIPQGTTIDTAFIQFHVDEIVGGSSDPLSVTIFGEDVDDSSAYTSSDFDLSGRTETTATVQWAIPTWVDVSDEGAEQLTPDLKTIVQEILDRPSWVSGNDMNFMIKNQTGIGERHAESSDGDSADAPELTITFTGTPAGETMLFDDVTFTAVKLSEHFTKDVDYFFNFNNTVGAVDDTETWITPNDASISFTPPVSDTNYLVLGTANYEGFSAGTSDFRTRLMVSGAISDLPELSQENEDPTDEMVHTLARYLQLSNSTTLEMEATLRQDGGSRTNENRTSSAMFAINLDKFSHHEGTFIESSVALGDTEFGDEIAEIIFNPLSSDKDTLIIADMGFQDIEAEVEVRVQDNNVDTLPDQTINTYDFIDSWDVDDMLRWGLVTVENLSNSTHTIEVDASETTAGSTSSLHRTLIAVTLEATSPAPPQAFTSCMSLELMSVAVGEDLSVLVSPTFDTPKEVCVTTSGGADILRTFTWNFNSTEIPFEAEEVGIVKLTRFTNNTNEDFTGTVFGLFGELQWVKTTP